MIASAIQPWSVGRHAALAPHVALRARQPRPRVRQRQDPVQRRHREPDLPTAEIRPEMLNAAAGFDQVDDAQARPTRAHVHDDVDGHFPTARRPVPARHHRLEEVALQPGRFVLGIAGDGLDAVDAADHRGEVAAVSQVRPVRRNAVPQVRGPSDVEDAPSIVAEAVDAGRDRQLPDGLARGAIHSCAAGQSFSRSRAAFSPTRILTICVTSPTGIGLSAGNWIVPFPARYGVSLSPSASTTAPLAGKRL